ncbi:hypothetical protein BU23DRAFT_40523 [Bimuria novae-zelandiae CBS 107.79]|uniref:Mid2 domain-containing protein n=1 Tax=Bimuria novae-zelandiae CBS 107.79 TaxID=1447943 RepID=A0A6A5UJQ3_9PLEO|nr:hypothetical protein BU23DRAFT_40523 [Bimuria novae-zelandiae CBS 107.79]
MLSTMRSSWLLFALLALVAVSTAFSVEDALNIDGINAYLYHGVKRQAEGTGASSSAPAPSSTADTESTSAAEPSSTPDKPSSTPPPPTTTSAEPTPDAPVSTPTSAPSSPATHSSAPSPPPPPASSTSDAPAPSRTRASASISLTTRPLVSTEIAATTTVVTFVSQGQTIQQTSVGSRTVEHTTGAVTETALTNVGAGNGGGSSGLSSEKKAIIGGVIGGVGGAILLGGIAIVCWRMWGKKKRVSEDDADLMAGTGAALGDKSSTTNPFQSNLEQYHNPGGRPNAAANF